MQNMYEYVIKLWGLKGPHQPSLARKRVHSLAKLLFAFDGLTDQGSLNINMVYAKHFALYSFILK